MGRATGTCSRRCWACGDLDAQNVTVAMGSSPPASHSTGSPQVDDHEFPSNVLFEGFRHTAREVVWAVA
jgi:hypothetical protein